MTTPEEPTTRNSVVLLRDGAIARRHTARPTIWAGEWTVYPARPLATDLGGAIDPGLVMPWHALAGDVETVLHLALPPEDLRARPEASAAMPRTAGAREATPHGGEEPT